MKCPLDGTELVMTDRTGVEIDYCPRCRGVWLDRGELDKIIERSMGLSPSMAQARAPEPRRRERYDDDDDHKRYKKKKRGGWLEDIFDFD